MNIMAEQPGAAFQFSMEADDNMEISSPHTFHDQDIDIDLELGDGEEVGGEDENMLEDAPTDELLGMMGQAEPALIDDEMADDAPTPRQEIHTRFGFGSSGFNAEANDLDLLDDGEDYPFAGYRETDPSQEAELVNEYVQQDNSFQELPLASNANSMGSRQPSHGGLLVSQGGAVASLSLDNAGSANSVQPLESELSREQPAGPIPVASEHFSTVPAQVSMDRTEIAVPEPKIADITHVTYDNLDGASNLPGESARRAVDISVAPVEHDGSHPESGEGHYPPEAEPDEDGSSENTEVIPSLHPVVVKYQSEEMSLFQSKESEVEHSPTFLLQDQTLASQSILELLNACRDVLAGSVDNSEELSLRMDELGLDFSEASETPSLSEVLDNNANIWTDNP